MKQMHSYCFFFFVSATICKDVLAASIATTPDAASIEDSLEEQLREAVLKIQKAAFLNLDSTETESSSETGSALFSSIRPSESESSEVDLLVTDDLEDTLSEIASSETDLSATEISPTVVLSSDPPAASPPETPKTPESTTSHSLDLPVTESPLQDEETDEHLISQEDELKKQVSEEESSFTEDLETEHVHYLEDDDNDDDVHSDSQEDIFLEENAETEQATLLDDADDDPTSEEDSFPEDDVGTEDLSFLLDDQDDGSDFDEDSSSEDVESVRMETRLVADGSNPVEEQYTKEEQDTKEETFRDDVSDSSEVVFSYSTGKSANSDASSNSEEDSEMTSETDVAARTVENGNINAFFGQDAALRSLENGDVKEAVQPDYIMEVSRVQVNEVEDEKKESFQSGSGQVAPPGRRRALEENGLAFNRKTEITKEILNVERAEINGIPSREENLRVPQTANDPSEKLSAVNNERERKGRRYLRDTFNDLDEADAVQFEKSLSLLKKEQTDDQIERKKIAPEVDQDRFEIEEELKDEETRRYHKKQRKHKKKKPPCHGPHCHFGRHDHYYILQSTLDNFHFPEEKPLEHRKTKHEVNILYEDEEDEELNEDLRNLGRRYSSREQQKQELNDEVEEEGEIRRKKEESHGKKGQRGADDDEEEELNVSLEKQMYA